MVPQVELFSFVILGELKTHKRHFEINWPLIWHKHTDLLQFQIRARILVCEIQSGRFIQIFVVFSEYMNLSYSSHICLIIIFSLFSLISDVNFTKKDDTNNKNATKSQ